MHSKDLEGWNYEQDVRCVAHTCSFCPGASPNYWLTQHAAASSDPFSAHKVKQKCSCQPCSVWRQSGSAGKVGHCSRLECRTVLGQMGQNRVVPPCLTNCCLLTNAGPFAGEVDVNCRAPSKQQTNACHLRCS